MNQGIRKITSSLLCYSKDNQYSAYIYTAENRRKGNKNTELIRNGKEF